MRICVVGSGGREHALAEALARTAEVVVTPGNPGIPWSTPAPVHELAVDLYVIGPEAPLVDGLADRLRAGGALVFGPGADGARLEGSKAWMKDVLAGAGVPTAAHRSFRGPQVREAIEFLRSLPGPYVVKADGLAAGKGVLVTDELGEAAEDVRAKLPTGVVIEAGLAGPEVSLMCLSDGERVVPLPSARDHKRVGDGDTGPNTGGMGAFSPVPAVDAAEGERLAETIVAPTLHELRRRGIDYRGVLYAGLMLTADGPCVLEYNVRFGDPETQVVVPRLDGDLAATLAEAAAGRLRTVPTVRGDAAVTVVAATEGYPVSPRTGDVIDGLDAARTVEGVRVYCAGVAAGPDGRLVTAGGRVLSVTGTGTTLEAARRRTYDGLGRLSWRGIQHRSDIALIL
jgi:phosphoribosylamine--glycine ligase